MFSQILLNDLHRFMSISLLCSRREKIEDNSDKGFVQFNTSTIEEFDLGDYALHLTSYTAHNEKGIVAETGTYVFCQGFKCMYVCMYVCTCVCNVCMYVCMYVCLYVYMYVCMHVYVLLNCEINYK